MEKAYPLSFAVDYPDRPLDRVSSAFRIFAVIPIAIVLGTIGGYSGTYGSGAETTTVAIGGIGLLFLPPLLMLLFRQKYPRWWFDWNLELLRFGNRVGIYLALMDDRYPSTDEQQSVRLDFPYPDARLELNRWLPLVKWLLAIPHYIVLFFLWIGAVLAVIATWFAILFSGSYPRSLFDYVEGVIRWHNRVIAYAFILVTDEYPPFRLAVSHVSSVGLLRVWEGAGTEKVGRSGPSGRNRWKDAVMTEQTITVTLTEADAEILLGVLSAERHNADAQAVCDAVRDQLDEQLGRTDPAGDAA